MADGVKELALVFVAGVQQWRRMQRLRAWQRRAEQLRVIADRRVPPNTAYLVSGGRIVGRIDNLGRQAHGGGQ